MLAVTNAFEGAIFVNASAAAASTLSDYVTQLFPELGPQQIAAAVTQYTGVPGETVLEQAIAVMGECTYAAV